MKEFEIGMTDKGSAYQVQVYSPKYATVVLERTQEFASRSEARCWFETVATLEKEYEAGFFGKITEKDLAYAEELMEFRYTDIA